MLELSNPQSVFLNVLPTKFRAFVGGFGSGKTFVGCLDLVQWAIKHPGYNQGYYAPTVRDIRDTFYPAIEEAAALLGLRCEIRTGNKEVHLYAGRFYYGTIICRSMHDPGSIVGYKVVRALVDEIDIMPKDKAALAWQKIIARLRQKVDGVLNDVGVTTTPEGFRFVYSKFKENPKASYSMVQASTYENEEYLPEDYISSLLSDYPTEVADAYIRGQFVNLTSGTVFYSFDRKRNNTDAVEEPKEPLKIGMDFNVQKMAAAIYVERKQVWHQVAELSNIFDTPAMIRTLNENYPDHPKVIYPDATGGNRKSVDASVTDIKLLRGEGWEVRCKDTNPRVRDRIISANAAYEKNKVLVNVERCPETARCLEQLAYDRNGEPDKKSDLDHLPDAATYPIHYELPVIKPVARPDIIVSI